MSCVVVARRSSDTRPADDTMIPFFVYNNPVSSSTVRPVHEVKEVEAFMSQTALIQYHCLLSVM